ncbi:MAG TPA: proton-conducting transporter membrane subunit [Solirubrobacteraceae bacterium]
MSSLSALPVVVPFLAGPLLVATGSFAPRWLEDGTAVLAAISVCALCVLLAVHAATEPFAYWLGGYRPHHGVAIGISLSIDPLGAGLGAFAALLVSAALVYSIHYFDAVKGLFHGLMLLFMAGMVGFCLTGDLFDLVVFFELMSAAAFALTAYRIEERAPLQGAINFAITNSIGGYGMFIGVALLYARTGALNMAQIGAALGGHQADPLVIVAMVLLIVGFLTKAAAVPLHFWLADAHAVAPVPVCVLFSGVMVELGIYAVARLYWVIFSGPMGASAPTLRAILITLGVVTALLGALMCAMQRHIKRLLAFSTISHVGMFICGLGLLSAKALAGIGVYLVGHGLTKGALFMCAGVLLHRFATIDEYDLHGRGRAVPVVGVLMAAGALLLTAAPGLTTYFGKSLLEAAASDGGYGWLIAVFIVVSAVTGGAVLRITGRVFLGWGPNEGPDPGQARAAAERVDETRGERDRTPILMVIVPAVLLVVAAVLGLVPDAVPAIERDAARFVDHGAYARWVLHGLPVAWAHVATSHEQPVDVLYSVLAVAGAVGTAALGLFGRPLREGLPARLTGASRSALHSLRRLHSGHIGDYIAWWTAGAATLGLVCLVGLR